MSEQKLHAVTQDEPERAVLVGLILHPTTREEAAEHIEELKLLADTAGAVAVATVMQALSKPDGGHYLGKGKIEEIKLIVEEELATIVIINDDLTPVQTRNLEKDLDCKVIDRSGLILDIFAKHAKSSEARTQVELAQLQYLLPRLTRQWTHLSKQFGGIGTKGPGETQIETDRRMIRVRIAHLREKLQKIETQQETQRKGRSEMFRVALVGYTNAGKSTLMNELSAAAVHTEDRLFATLDTTVRSVELAPKRSALLSDTVGFIRNLPSHLIASFRTTLSEVREADLLLHVVDVSSKAVVDHIAVVNDTLEQIGARDVPVMMVFNKVDLLGNDRDALLELIHRYPDGIAVSAAKGVNIAELRRRLVSEIEDLYIRRTVRVPMDRYHLLSKIHNHADVIAKEFDDAYAYVSLMYSPKVDEQVGQILSAANAEASSKIITTEAPSHSS